MGHYRKPARISLTDKEELLANWRLCDDAAERKGNPRPPPAGGSFGFQGSGNIAEMAIIGFSDDASFGKSGRRPRKW
jgi:hypothetical protein